MRIGKALKLAIEGKKVRIMSWYPGDYVYCCDGRFWLVTNKSDRPGDFVVYPSRVLAEDWEVLE